MNMADFNPQLRKLWALTDPCYKAVAHPKINRRPTQKEIQAPKQYAIKKGLNVLD